MENNNLNEAQSSPLSANLAPEHKILSPKEFFLSAGILIAFVTFIATSVIIFFKILDEVFPDMALSRGIENFTISNLSVPLSIVIVFFPVLCVLVYFTNRYYTENPDRLSSKFRKWIMYLVFFVSFITIVIDLVVTIWYFLNGDFTSRFVLKSLVVLVYAVMSSLYFNSASKNIKTKTITITSILFVITFLCSVIIPFFVFGSPMKARSVTMDNNTINNLTQLENDIANYYAINNRLPVSISETVSVTYLSQDAMNKISYTKINDKTFKLCGDFNVESNSTTGYYGNPYQTIPVGENRSYYIHGQGTVCFEKQIVPQNMDQVKMVK